MRVFADLVGLIVFGANLYLLPSYFCPHKLYDCCFVKNGEIESQGRPEVAAVQSNRFITCAVTQGISQLCLPWTLPWVLGGRDKVCMCDNPFTNMLPLCAHSPIWHFNTFFKTVNKSVPEFSFRSYFTDLKSKLFLKEAVIPT